MQKWVVTTGGDVSATPAVDNEKVYFPDWAGNLSAVDKGSGGVVWQKKISDYTGIPGDKARATPAFTDSTLVIGNQGPFGGGGAIIAINKANGALLWKTQLESHPSAIITQSATIFDGVVYVGVSSLEEAIAVFVPGYICCTFRGSMAALDLATGKSCGRRQIDAPALLPRPKRCRGSSGGGAVKRGRRSRYGCLSPEVLSEDGRRGVHARS